MILPPIPVGFNYAQAILEIRKRMTLEQIAEFIGYESSGSIGDITNRGRIPNHPQGQAIWVLYVELFGRKPPMSAGEAAGVTDLRICATRKEKRAA